MGSEKVSAYTGYVHPSKVDKPLVFDSPNPSQKDIPHKRVAPRPAVDTKPFIFSVPQNNPKDSQKSKSMARPHSAYQAKPFIFSNPSQTPDKIVRKSERLNQRAGVPVLDYTKELITPINNAEMTKSFVVPEQAHNTCAVQPVIVEAFNTVEPVAPKYPPYKRPNTVVRRQRPFIFDTPSQMPHYERKVDVSPGQAFVNRVMPAKKTPKKKKAKYQAKNVNGRVIL